METTFTFASKEELNAFISRLFAICTTLSVDVIRAISRRAQSITDVKLPKNYVARHLIRNMLLSGVIYESSPHNYTIAGKKEDKSKHSLDCLWVFLQHMDGANLLSLMKGPRPSSITYIKGNRIYHIVRCNDSGIAELGMAVQAEIDMNSRRRGGKADYVEERFFFIFDSQDAIDRAPFRLESKTLFVLISYEEGTRIPTFNYVSA